MRISARGEYAIKAVLELALHHEAGLLPIQEIAARQGIPQRYLEQVLLSLRRARLLVSKRGSTGGYQLTRPPGEITVGEVLRVVEGTGAPLEAPGARAAADGQEDVAELWEEIAESISRVVDRLTFADLAGRARARRSAARTMYHI
jgi:Rrf2 family protein